MVRYDEPAARRELARVIQRRRGNMTECAADLGLQRRQFFRLVHRFNLWRLVFAERRRLLVTEPLEMAHGNGRRPGADS
jgi:hypothetical protein